MIKRVKGGSGCQRGIALLSVLLMLSLLVVLANELVFSFRGADE